MKKVVKTVLPIVLVIGMVLVAVVYFFTTNFAPLLPIGINIDQRNLELSTSLPGVDLAEQIVLGSEFVPFYVPTAVENGVLYVGYSYGRDTEARAVQAFYYDTTTKEVVQQTTIPDQFFSDVCASDSEMILSSDNQASIAVTAENGQIVTASTTLSCSSKTPVVCDGGKLFRGVLPGSTEELAVCYNHEGRTVDFNLITTADEIVNIDSVTNYPSGSGRFGVSRGLTPDTYLLHHTERLVEETAVEIDVLNKTVDSITVPDTTAARPSRGFGAGNFEVKLHPVAGGFLGEGAGGKTYLVKENGTTILSADTVAHSAFVMPGGCTATLVTKVGNGMALNKYNFCVDSLSSTAHSCPAFTKPDGSDFDWRQITSDQELKDCLLELAKSMESQQQMTDWLREQGFSNVELVSSTPGRVYLNATWDVELSGSPVPFMTNFSLFERWIMRNKNYIVQVRYSDGVPEQATAHHVIL